MALEHPEIELISLDLSDGVYTTLRRLSGLPNAHVIRADIQRMPLRSGIADLVYSFGVLHHLPSAETGFAECARVARPGGSVVVYLYEDFSDGSVLKRLGIHAVSVVRKATTRLPTGVLWGLCRVAAPLVFLAFTGPARLLRKLSTPGARALADKLPYNMELNPRGITGALYDRFGAQIERRFSRAGIEALFQAHSFTSVALKKFPNWSGWVAFGTKGELQTPHQPAAQESPAQLLRPPS